MQYRDLVYRIHARQSMFTRSISDECVEHILQSGEVIEYYPQAFPFPAKLLLGWWNGRPIHVVAAENSSKEQVIVITAYEPTLEKWETDRKTRRR
nr:DUF4258 domain-containing protein [Ktedonobacteraceae bacterium]